MLPNSHEWARMVRTETVDFPSTTTTALSNLMEAASVTSSSASRTLVLEEIANIQTAISCTNKDILQYQAKLHTLQLRLKESMGLL